MTGIRKKVIDSIGVRATHALQDGFTMGFLFTLYIIL